MKTKWKTKKLGDVCKSASSNVSLRKIENNEGKYPIYRANGFFKNVDFYHQNKVYISIIKDGSGFGRVNKREAFSSIIGTLQYIIPNNNADINFLYYFLLGIDFKKYVSGAAIPHIYFKDYRNEELKIPTLKTQKQIVKILDQIFSQISKSKESAEKNLKNAKELFESYLEGVFSNQGKDWKEKKLGDICNKVGSGATPRGGQKSYKQSGISLIRSMNVHDRSFTERKLAYIDKDQASKLDNVKVEVEDVLLNITGASVARCCKVDNSYLPARVNQHVSIIRVDKKIIFPDFLEYLLTSKYSKDILLGIGRKGGATREAITKYQIQEFKVSFPPLPKQKVIVQKLDALSKEIKELETIYSQKVKNLDELKKSILQKAFSGELTK